MLRNVFFFCQKNQKIKPENKKAKNYLKVPFRNQRQALQLFEDKKVRALWDSDQEKWYFSIVDTIMVLTESVDPPAYSRKLKQRLKEEGNETVTNCHGLKMQASDGKMRMTDVADTEQLFRLIQSIPSPKAEPFKLWLAQIASERLDEMQDSVWDRNVRKEN